MDNEKLKKGCRFGIKRTVPFTNPFFNKGDKMKGGPHRRPTQYDGNTPGCKGCIYNGPLGTCLHPHYIELRKTWEKMENWDCGTHCIGRTQKAIKYPY